MSTSMKTLEKRCEEVDFQLGHQVLVWSSPQPAALLSSAVLCRSLKRSGRLFQFSICSPLEDVGAVNNLRDRFSHHTIVLVGVDLQGTKRLKKGAGYPLFMGGTCESDQTANQSIGERGTTTASAYAFAQSKMNVEEYETALASAGALLEEGFGEPTITANKDHVEKRVKANKELIERALDEGLIEERKGLRLVGADWLPLNQLFLHSTRPFLRGMSGDRKACDDVLHDADIPTPKYEDPISSLNTKELQRLNTVLISRVPAIIPYLDPDYILPREDRSSPLRSISEMRATLETSWTLREFGTAFGVLLGDRGASLRLLLDSHKKHREEVVTAFLDVESRLGKGSLPTDVSLHATDQTLPDVGRIILELGLVGPEQSHITVSNDSSTEIIWNGNRLEMSQVLRELCGVEPQPISTSSKSLRFSKLNQPELSAVVERIVKGGKK